MKSAGKLRRLDGLIDAQDLYGWLEWVTNAIFNMARLASTRLLFHTHSIVPCVLCLYVCVCELSGSLAHTHNCWSFVMPLTTITPTRIRRIYFFVLNQNSSLALCRCFYYPFYKPWEYCCTEHVTNKELVTATISLGIYWVWCRVYCLFLYFPILY